MNELLSSVRKWALLIFVAVLVVCACVFGWSLWALGGKAVELKEAKAETKAVVKATKKANAKVRADLARADSTSQGREQDRARLDDFFDQLNREAEHAPTTADDHYVLPDERLRIWRDANAGRPDPGPTTGQPDDGAAAIAAAGLGRDSGAGGEPPRGGEGLSPARVADVPAAGLPAVANGGL